MAKKVSAKKRRSERVRRSVCISANGRPRLSVYRSSKNIYAQIIDDIKGHTLVFASTLDKSLRERTGSDSQAASLVGKMIAERSLAIGVNKVVFDRGPYIFHGRVKALADAAREGGLVF